MHKKPIERHKQDSSFIKWATLTKEILEHACDIKANTHAIDTYNYGNGLCVTQILSYRMIIIFFQDSSL